MAIQDTSAASFSVPVSGETLQRDAMGLTGVVMQALAAFAPAFAIVLLFQVTVGFSGITAPLVFLFAYLIVLVLALSVTQLYKEFPSAGGFYTQISRTVSARVGFMAGWIYMLALPPSGVLVVAFTADAVLQPQLNAAYGIDIPWWVYVLAIGALVGVLVYRGISISQKTVVVLGAAELAICVILGISGLISPGNGGLNLSSFNPANSPSFQGLYLGVVFSIFVYTGWEQVANLAEETREPKKTISRGTIIAISIWAAFLVFCTWAFLIGAGTSNTNAIVSSESLPPLDLAHRVWGGAWVIVLLAILNSAIAVSVVSVNASTRLWYGMARSKVLPASLAKLHPKFKTPTNAIYLEGVFSAVVFGLAAYFGPAEIFTFWSLSVTFGVILVYCALNTGVIRHFALGEGRRHFNVFFHVIFPLASSAAVIWVGYKSVVPLPEPPAKYSPIGIAIWIALGLLVLVVLHLQGNDNWLERAGKAMDEEEEVMGRPGLEPQRDAATTHP